MKKVRVGLVGLSMGFYATTYIREAARLQGVQVVGICDLGYPEDYVLECSGLTAQALGAELGVPVVHDLGALFALEPDAVIVTSEIHEHARHIVAALEAGVHVFCAKPITVWESHMEQILSAVADKRLIVLPGQPARYDDGLKGVVDTVRYGKIGHPLLVRIFVQHEAMRPRWCREYAKSGGGFSEFGYYCADFAFWLMQTMPEEVYGYGINAKNPDMDLWDNAVMIMKYHEKALVTATLSLTINWTYPWFDLEIIGSTGAVRTQSHNYSYLVHHQNVIYVGPVRYSEMNMREIHHFISCIRGEEQPQYTVREAMAAVKTLEALRKSMELGQAIKL